MPRRETDPVRSPREERSHVRFDGADDAAPILRTTRRTAAAVRRPGTAAVHTNAAIRTVTMRLRGDVQGLRDGFASLTRLSGLVAGVVGPWVLLAARIWLGQVVFVHRIMAMMHDGSLHAPVPALPALWQAAVLLLLAAGLLTRPVALALLVEAIVTAQDASALALTGPRAAILVWLVVLGAGPLSIDFLLRGGLSRVPVSGVRAVSRLYLWIMRFCEPVLLLGVRVGFALAVGGMGAVALRWARDAMLGAGTGLSAAGWWAIPIASLLLLGLATRAAALLLGGVIEMAAVTMTPEDRVGVLLLLLLLAARGGGWFSLDRLLVRWASIGPAVDAGAADGRPHVVVVGGGFGGIAAVRGLRRVACRITVIDRRNHHLFQPLLYQVATAALSPADIATPIRSMLRGQRNVRVRLGQVNGVDTQAGAVLLGAERIPFDFLVIATGARHSYFGHDDWAPHAPGLKSIEDATGMRSRLLRAFERAETARDPAERDAWLTFVVVGGGPTGVELAGALAELARTGLEQEYRAIDPTAARVILVQSAPRVLPSFPPALSVRAESALRALGVEVRTNARVRSVDQRGAEIDGTRIDARTTFWAAGVAASPAADWLGRPGDPSGRVIVSGDLSAPGLPRIFAIGDTASSLSWNGAAAPGLAPAAKQQGEYVARVIRATVDGTSLPPAFRYRHFGSLATIGRLAAVAEFGRVRLWGAPAWWFWGAAHLLFLVGGRNRAAVVLNWLWAYVTYRRSTRLITGEPAASGET